MTWDITGADDSGGPVDTSGNCCRKSARRLSAGFRVLVLRKKMRSIKEIRRDSSILNVGMKDSVVSNQIRHVL